MRVVLKEGFCEWWRKRVRAYPGIVRALVKPVLMHDPVRLLPMWGSSFVKHEGLPQPDPRRAAVYDLVTAGRLPKPHGCRAVRPSPSRVLLVLVAKEVPIVLRPRSYLALLYMYIQQPVKQTSLD